MTEPKKKFARYTITSALPYANGPIHIGHLAGVYIPADIYARFLRSKGEDVLFIGGSDEHGFPITIKARTEKVSPQEIVDKYHNIIKKSFEQLGISFDIYSRTSALIHHKTSSDIFKSIYDKGIFIEKESEQYFDEDQQQFLADRYITGTCPHCNYEKAYGDQCEKCGTSLNATDLINPVSVLSDKKPVLKSTKHWFLPLDNYESWLKDWILEGHKDDWRATVYGQCKSWIDKGLQPRAVTRDLDWGVKVPLAEAVNKVLYVWFDAPIGYISAAKEWSLKTGKDWQPYWKDENSRLVHFIGKDNIVFHCIIFPVILKAEGSFILPDNVPANSFLNLEGDKISTSRNWAVWLNEYLDEMPGKQDTLRYVLTANAPETKDNDFTWKDFQLKNNSELVAILGNFINRIFVLTHKYFKGIVPEVTELKDIDHNLVKEIALYPDKIARQIETFHFREALSELMNLARAGNKYLTENEPWKVFKDNPDRVKTVLNISLQLAANLAILGEPFLPFASVKLFDLLNLDQLKWQSTGVVDIFNPGHQIKAPSLLFENITDEAINFQMQKLLNTKLSNVSAASTIAPLKPAINYEDFAKIDFRIATILEAEPIPKANKLLKLKVDTGIDQRIVVAGIAEHYKPEEIIGQKVVIVANLSPKELKGIKSNGMILMAENPEGKLCFISQTADFPNGGTVK